MLMVSRSELNTPYTSKAMLGVALIMISSLCRLDFLKRDDDWGLMSLCQKVSWLGTRMEVLWKTSLGRTMA